METPNYSAPIKKITDRLKAIDCGYDVEGNEIHVEFSIYDLMGIANINVHALLDMEEHSGYYGADWQSPSVIVVYTE